MTKTREQWLNEAVEEFRPWFKEAGSPLPKKIAVSCGFPRSKKAIGVCHDPAWIVEEGKQHHQIWICPTQDECTRVLDILLHELCHAALPSGTKHGKAFKELALNKMGLEGKATATIVTEGSELHKKLKAIAKKLGKYPHTAMRAPAKKEKDGESKGGWIRLYSREIEGYAAVVSPKMLEEYGPPSCPCGHHMVPKEELE